MDDQQSNANAYRAEQREQPDQLGMTRSGHFQLGQIVRHRLFGYLGVIIDVDPQCSPSEVNYQSQTDGASSTDEPWFKLLVHNTDCEGYAAQEDLLPLNNSEGILHPHLRCYFRSFDKGVYKSRIAFN